MTNLVGAGPRDCFPAHADGGAKIAHDTPGRYGLLLPVGLALDRRFCVCPRRVAIVPFAGLRWCGHVSSDRQRVNAQRRPLVELAALIAANGSLIPACIDEFALRHVGGDSCGIGKRQPLGAGSPQGMLPPRRPVVRVVIETGRGRSTGQLVEMFPANSRGQSLFYRAAR
jgi:hypothetical protein